VADSVLFLCHFYFVVKFVFSLALRAHKCLILLYFIGSFFSLASAWVRFISLSSPRSNFSSLYEFLKHVAYLQFSCALKCLILLHQGQIFSWARFARSRLLLVIARVFSHSRTSGLFFRCRDFSNFLLRLALVSTVFCSSVVATGQIFLRFREYLTHVAKGVGGFSCRSCVLWMLTFARFHCYQGSNCVRPRVPKFVLWLVTSKIFRCVAEQNAINLCFVWW
jgi:hypothetical protein